MGINLAERGYNEVNAAMPGEFSQLPAGGYICRVINAELSDSKAGNKMLVLFIDVAQGDFTGHFKAAFDRVKNFNSNLRWDNSGIYRQLLFDKTSGRVASFFKGLLICFEKSNPNFKVNIQNFDAASLRGKLIGFVFAEEEYTKKDFSTGTRVFAKFPKTVEDISIGNFTVPELKKVQSEKPPDTKPQSNNYDFGEAPIDPDDTPF